MQTITICILSKEGEGVGMTDHEICDIDLAKRKYFWYCYDNTGFPKIVNHAVAVHINEKSGDASVFSVGGFTEIVPGDHRLKSTDIDIHKFDVTSRTWSSIKTRSMLDDPFLAPRPKSRYGHSVCSYDAKLYIFGGRNDDDGSIKPVSCLDIATNSWVNCPTGGQVPEARDGHGCTMIGPVMFIHGGYCEMKSGLTNTLYGLNLDTFVWRLYPCHGIVVKERHLHTATAVDNHKIIVFGGRCRHVISSLSYDDKFYCYDLKDGRWSHLITSGYQPMGRRSHVAASCRESVIYFGGYNPIKDIHFADLFVLNVNTNHITEVRPWGEYPCPRRRPACVLVGLELIICGGTSPMLVGEKNQQIMNDHSDTFVLNLFPSLQEMCLSFILVNGIEYSSLPLHLCSYLAKLSEKRTEKELIL